MQKLTNLLLLAFLSTTSGIFAQDTEAVRIGVFLDISSFGITSYNGVKMAVSEINNSGGANGRKLEVFVEDDLGRPERAKELAKKLITEHKVHVLIGEVASTNSLAAAPVAQEAKVPMITPSSTNPKVTEVGNYIFRACFVDPVQGGAMARFAYNNLKLRRVAIFGDAQSDYSKSLAQDFSNVFKSMGGRISSDQTYLQVDADFKKRLRTIRKTKPAALYLPGYYGQVAIIARQARELGMEVPLLGGDGWDSPELWKLGGNALRNSYLTNHFVIDNGSSTVKDFRKKYLAIYESEPDTLAALAYDTVYLVANAVQRAKSLDSAALRDALAATTDFHGIAGSIARFDASRNPIKPIVIVKSDPKNSTFVYNTTIQP